MSNEHRPQTRYFVDLAGIVYAAYPKYWNPDVGSGLIYTKSFQFLMVKNNAGQYEIEIHPDYYDELKVMDDELNHWIQSGYWEEINFPFQLKPQFEYLGPEKK